MVILPEGESQPLSRELIVGGYAVLQPSGLPNDGQRAVAKGYELRQAAWLESRWHEEHIGARVYAVGQGGIVAVAGGYPAAIPPAGPGKQVLVACIAVAEDCQLHALFHQRRHGVFYQVKALLVRKAGDNANYG